MGTCLLADAAPLLKDAVSFVQGHWNLGARSWDARALAELFLEDALFYGAHPGHFVGRAAIQKYYASYDGIVVRATLALQDQHVALLAPGTVLAQGIGAFSVLLASGQQTESTVRTTLVIVQRGNNWKILAHHFSTSPASPPLGP